MLRNAIFFCCLFFIAGCAPDRTVSRAFYYWKSTVDLAKPEMDALNSLQVKKLYVKFFDVTWDAALERPSPAARVRFTDSSKLFLKNAAIEIIPTVFITNETLDRILPETVDKLGQRVDFLLRDLLDTYRITDIKEIQIDCDWTERTRDKYFDLLRYLKTLPFYLKRELSATIRLYQSKYQTKTGIPPVNKGLLMCYNMGNLKSSKTTNSILDPSELERYTDNLSSYPLPLDIGLPLFGWKVLFRDNVYAGLIQNLPDSVLNQPVVSTLNGGQFEIIKDTLLYGYDLKKGDKLRVETSEVKDILQSVSIVSPQLRAPNITISFYHLDSATLSKFKQDELENIYRGFHQ
jgi:hypothetical protein